MIKMLMISTLRMGLLIAIAAGLGGVGCDLAETIAVTGFVYLKDGTPAAGLVGRLEADSRGGAFSSQEFTVAPDGSYAALFDLSEALNGGDFDGTEQVVVHFKGEFGNLIESRFASLSPALQNEFTISIQNDCVQEFQSGTSLIRVNMNSERHESFEKSFTLNLGLEDIEAARACQNAAFDRAAGALQQ